MENKELINLLHSYKNVDINCASVLNIFFNIIPKLILKLCSKL